MTRTTWLLLLIVFLQTGIIWGMVAVIFQQQRIIVALGSPDLRRVLDLLLPRWFTWTTQRMGARFTGASRKQRKNSRDASTPPEPALFVWKSE